MRELALFAGAGGGILGGHLLGWQTVCAVEYDRYCQQILMQRQDDGLLQPFPIWSDVRTFEGRYWRGHVDVITGGFPCQDISAAGKGAGIEGERSGLWGQMARIIGEVRPRYALMENSPLLVGRGLAVVLRDLVTMGYDARWCVLGADNVGAPHRRKRIWILAHAHGAGLAQRENVAGNAGKELQTAERGRAMANASGGRRGEPETREVQQPGRAETFSSGAVHNPQSIGREGRYIAGCDGKSGCQRAFPEPARVCGGWWSADPADVGNANGEHGRPGAGGQDGAQAGDPSATEMDHACGQRHQRPDYEVSTGGHPDLDASWWALESRLDRVADGVANRVDRLRAIGNGQVPAVAAAAWRLLGGPVA